MFSIVQKSYLLGVTNHFNYAVMEFVALSEFARELKRLGKKYHSLQNDLEIFKSVIVQYPQGNGSKHWNKLYERENVAVFKTRLACASLRGQDKMRIIYAFKYGNQQIDLIELYYKGEKENEDSRLIKSYLKGNRGPFL